MALDLTGIDNVEFYSGHYLDAVLEGDLKATTPTFLSIVVSTSTSLAISIDTPGKSSRIL